MSDSKFSPLILETKVRYFAALSFLVFFISFFLYSFLDIELLFLTAFGEFGFISVLSIIPTLFVFLWAHYNRWYFMIPAMISTGVLFLFSIVLVGVHSEHLVEDGGFAFISLFVECIVFASFGMYVIRNIKQLKR